MHSLGCCFLHVTWLKISQFPLLLPMLVAKFLENRFLRLVCVYETVQRGSYVEVMYVQTCITACSTFSIPRREKQSLKMCPKVKSKYTTVMHQHQCLLVIPQEGKHMLLLPRSCGPLRARGPAGKLYHHEDHPVLAGDHSTQGKV